MPWARASTRRSAASGLTAEFHEGKHQPLPLLYLLDHTASARRLQGLPMYSHQSLCSKTGQGWASTGLLRAVISPTNHIRGLQGAVALGTLPHHQKTERVRTTSHHHLLRSTWGLVSVPSGCWSPGPLPLHEMGRSEQTQQGKQWGGAGKALPKMFFLSASLWVQF